LKIVVKVGGTLLDEAATLQALARQLAEISRENELVIVHGGGKQVTRFLEERGVQSRFVGGLRVSDQTVIDAVTQVIAGAVNTKLVAAIIAAGEAAVGLSGVDGSLTTAVQLDPALCYVGKPTHTDARLLDLLVNTGYLPVIACIAGDASGNIYNVNADGMAVSCAAGWLASKLFFLTDVPGVKGADNSLLPKLGPADIAQLISSGVAHGGMQAKLEAALVALSGGLSEVVIAAGRESGICHRLLSGDAVGTRIKGMAQS
jgi:acetylglutamate kinase